MNRELIMVIEQLGREKGIDKEVLFEALETALLSASRKSLGPGDNVRIHIDRKTGDFRVYQRKQVVEEVADPETQIALADAKGGVSAKTGRSGLRARPAHRSGSARFCRRSGPGREHWRQ